MKIAVASGKGGTGKTTVAVLLYHFLSSQFHGNIKLADCDVEEPNDALFFPEAKPVQKKDAKRFVPYIDTAQCTFCKNCSEWCEFNAIIVIPGRKIAEIDPIQCHSCGACLMACNENAILEQPDLLGTVTHFGLDIGKGLAEGRLKVGSAMQTALIKELKKQVFAEMVIYDAPPGTSCPVVETTADADFIVLVTEPTPFGLYDLKITVNLMNQMQKPFGIIINKAGTGNKDVYKYLWKNKILILGEIPFSKEFASMYAGGNLTEKTPESIHRSFVKILENLKSVLSL